MRHYRHALGFLPLAAVTIALGGATTGRARR